MLSQLLYASRATHPLSDAELQDLLTLARVNNARLGVTGLLLYCDQSFLQVLEGEEATLTRLYEAIARDPRHTELRLLARGPLVERRHAEWCMGFEHLDDQRLAATLPGYRSARRYPLVAADLVRDGAVAETLLSLYARNN